MTNATGMPALAMTEAELRSVPLEPMLQKNVGSSFKSLRYKFFKLIFL
jgi:hypothetical protein